MRWSLTLPSLRSRSEVELVEMDQMPPLAIRDQENKNWPSINHMGRVHTLTTDAQQDCSAKEGIFVRILWDTKCKQRNMNMRPARRKKAQI